MPWPSAQDARLAGAGDEGRVGHHGLQAAALAATAQRAVGADAHVPELAGATPETAVDVASGNDAEPDAAADGDGDEVLVPFAAAVQALPDGQRVDVVVDEHGHVEPFLQKPRQRQVAPAEQRRVERAGGRVEHARDADAEPEQGRRRRRAREPVVEDGAEPLDRVVGRGVEGALESLEHLRLEVHAHPHHVIRGDLRTQHGGGLADELEQDGGPSAARGGVLGDVDEPLRQQFAGDPGHGGGAEPEPRGDRLAGDRPGRCDQPEDGGAVDVAREPRGRRGVRPCAP